MAMPQTLRDTRGYRSRYINALNAVVRSIAPIAGRGIRLRQTAHGTVIEATAKSTTAEGTVEAPKPWQVGKQTVADTGGNPVVWWCVYEPVWHHTIRTPPEGEDNPEPWEGTDAQTPLTLSETTYPPVADGSKWRRVITDEALQTQGGSSLQTLYAVLAPGAEEVALEWRDSWSTILGDDDETGALWLAFAQVQSAEGVRTLVNRATGTLSDTIEPGREVLCSKPRSPTSSQPDRWATASAGNDTLSDYLFALVVWASRHLRLDLLEAAFDVGEAEYLATGGFALVSHLEDHVEGQV